jgi:hypothetical protein
MANHALVRKASPIPPGIDMHDSWVAKVAAVTGDLGYIDQPLVQYRVHDKNASGVYIPGTEKDPRSTPLWDKIRRIPREGVIGRVQRRIGRIQEGERFRNTQAAVMAEQLLVRFGGEVDEEKRRVLERCVKLPSMGLTERIDAIKEVGLMPATLRHRARTVLFAGDWLNPDNNSR